MDDNSNVVRLREVSLRDIPGMLRKTADAIESGNYGEPESALLILKGEEDWPDVFSFGDGTQERAIFLMELAKQFLINHVTSR